MSTARALCNRHLAVLVGVALFGVLYLARQPVTPNSDTLRDFLLARDCVDGATCHTAGAPSGLGGFQQHATWIWVLVGAHWLHLGIAGLHVIGLAAAALTAALVFSMARRFMPPAFALLAALADVLAIRTLIPLHVLHNPTLLPLATTLVFWAALRLLDRRRLRDVALVALFVALSVELHGIGALLVVPLLIWIGLSQSPPGLATVLAAAVMVAVHSSVSPQAFARNFATAQAHALGAIGAVACFATLGLAVWLRRRFDALSAQRQRWVWLAMGGTYPLLAVGLVEAFHEDFLPYYFLPALAPLTILAAGALAAFARGARGRWSRPVVWLARAGALGLALFVMLSSQRWTDTSCGFDLEQMPALAKQLAARGVGYQEAFALVQGQPHAVVVAAVAAFEPTPRSGGMARPGPVLDLFAVHGGSVPAGVQQFPIPGHAVAALVSVESWLDRTHLVACTEPADRSAPGSCVPTAVAPPRRALVAPVDFGERAYPRMGEMDRAAREGRLHEWPATRMTFRYDVHVGAGIGRTLWLQDPDSSCRWHITRVTGVAVSGKLPGDSVVLRRGAGTEGTLEVSRVVTTGCPGAHERFAPALFEVALSDSAGQALAKRCRVPQ